MLPFYLVFFSSHVQVMSVLLVLLRQPNEQHRTHEWHQHPVQKPGAQQQHEEGQQLIICSRTNLKYSTHQKVLLHQHMRGTGVIRKRISMEQTMGLMYSAFPSLSVGATSLYSHTHGHWDEEEKSLTGCS